MPMMLPLLLHFFSFFYRFSYSPVRILSYLQVPMRLFAPGVKPVMTFPTWFQCQSMVQSDTKSISRRT